MGDVNSQFPAFNLPTDTARWAISHINFELEALANAQAGYTLRNLTVQSVSP